MQSRWIVCCVTVALAVPGFAAETSEYDWTGSIRPGMTRRRLEKIVFTPDSDAELSRRLYETQRTQVDEYQFDDGWAMVVPFKPLPRTGSGEVTKAQTNAQKVAEKPWMIVDKAVTAGEAKEPYLRIHLPGEAGRNAHRPQETAQILAGDIFRNGREVALVAFSNQNGTDYFLDALALYRKKGGKWALRSFFPMGDAFAGIRGDSHFLALNELSGDEVPEVEVYESSGRNPTSAIFRYDPAADRLILAIDEIHNPTREGREVTGFGHYGGPYFAAAGYVWRGNKLVLRSRTDQGSGSSGSWWIEPPETPAGAEDDWRVGMQHAERNAATGRIDGWESVGNVGWLFGRPSFVGNNANLAPLVWAIFQIGQLRRTVLITPNAKALAARSIKPDDVEFGIALFAKPERFSDDAKVNLPRGKTVRLKDVANVEIRDEWPPFMSHQEIELGDESAKTIPPLSLWVGQQERSLENAPAIPPDLARSRRKEGATTPRRHFGRSVPIAIYLVGQDRDPEAGGGLKIDGLKLEAGNIVHVSCTSEGKPPKANGPKVRAALALNLGRLEIGEYKAVVEFKPTGDGPAIATRELSFAIEK